MNKIVLAVLMGFLSIANAFEKQEVEELFLNNATEIELAYDLSNDCKLEIKVYGRKAKNKVYGRKAKNKEGCRDYINFLQDNQKEREKLVAVQASSSGREAMKNPRIIDHVIMFMEEMRNFKYILGRLGR